jgi:hypothetical protein
MAQIFYHILLIRLLIIDQNYEIFNKHELFAKQMEYHFLKINKPTQQP